MTFLKPYLLFFKKFLHQPKINASIIPSSKALAQAMIEGIDFGKINTIVEFGPGTGVFTQELIEQSKPGTTIICIEFDEEYVELLRLRFGNQIEVVYGDVHDLQSILARYSISQPDLIISGLPGNIYKTTLLDLLQTFIAQGMIFRGFSYAPHDSRTAYQGLPFVHKNFVLRNIPPAFVFGAN